MQEDNKHKERTPWKIMFGQKGLLKTQQNEQDIEGNTHPNVCENIYPSWNHLLHPNVCA